MANINNGDLVTVLHPSGSIITGTVQDMNGLVFWIRTSPTSYHCCHVSMVIARYQTIAA